MTTRLPDYQTTTDPKELQTMSDTKTVYATQATKLKGLRGQTLYAVTCYATTDHTKLGTVHFKAKAEAQAFRAQFLTFEDLPNQ